MFNLRCDPQEAAARLAILEDLGFTDVLVFRVRSANEQQEDSNRGRYEADYDAETLAAIRAILPARSNTRRG